MFGEGDARSEVNDELDRLVAELYTHSRKDTFSNWMSSHITGPKASPSDAEIICDLNESMAIMVNASFNNTIAKFKIPNR